METSAPPTTRENGAEERELLLALQTCQLIRRDLTTALDLVATSHSVGTWGFALFFVTVPLMVYKLHRSRRCSARAQRYQQLLDQQLDLLRDRRGLDVRSRSARNPLLQAERDLDVLAETYRGELARLRRIASVLRDRLADLQHRTG